MILSLKILVGYKLSRKKFDFMAITLSNVGEFSKFGVWKTAKKIIFQSGYSFDTARDINMLFE